MGIFPKNLGICVSSRSRSGSKTGLVPLWNGASGGRLVPAHGTNMSNHILLIVIWRHFVSLSRWSRVPKWVGLHNIYLEEHEYLILTPWYIKLKK